MDIEQLAEMLKAMLGDVTKRLDAIEQSKATSATAEELTQRITQLEKDKAEADRIIADRQRTDDLTAKVHKALGDTKVVDKGFITSHLLSQLGDVTDDAKIGDAVTQFLNTPVGKSMVVVDVPSGSGHPVDAQSSTSERGSGRGESKKPLGQVLRETNW